MLGGVATAIDAGVAAAMLDGEAEGGSSDETEEGQEAIALGDTPDEQSEGDRQIYMG